MTLQFEKLSAEVAKMAAAARDRTSTQDRLIDEILRLMRNRATDSAVVDRYVTYVNRNILQTTPHKPYGGAAFPLYPDQALDSYIDYDPLGLPKEATLIGVDGSQIVPDRHGAFIYHLINIGAIVYRHGSQEAPEIHGFPELHYPNADELNADRYTQASVVSIERDLAEIGRLAELVSTEGRPGIPTLGVMDQRLLYLPIGAADNREIDRNSVIEKWMKRLEDVHTAGGWIVGYIDRPSRASLLTLLTAFREDFDPDVPDDLGVWDGLADRQLFAWLLPAEARSGIFVNLTHGNQRYKEQNPAQEMCFFFLNTGGGIGPAANIARVDIPRWLAEDTAAVGQIHALLVHQCRQLGNYPYILARADEIAVVGKQDQATLEFRMAREMDKQGIASSETTKQDAKAFARGGKQRHEV